MSNKNEVFEYLIDPLRQQLPVVDVLGEIKRWSIDRSIVGRGIYTDEENAIIDAYIGLEHNPYKQQCEDLAHEVQSLKNQLRDASAQLKELHLALVKATGDAEDYKLLRKGKFAHEQSGRRKEDTQGWPYSFYYVVTDGSEAYRPIREQEQSGCHKEDTKECHHNWRFVNGKTPAVCINCGVTKAEECEHEWQFYGVGFPCMCLKCGLKK